MMDGVSKKIVLHSVFQLRYLALAFKFAIEYSQMTDIALNFSA
jgi:hypothetical protein